jgi:hypothetical protein
MAKKYSAKRSPIPTKKAMEHFVDSRKKSIFINLRTASPGQRTYPAENAQKRSIELICDGEEKRIAIIVPNVTNAVIRTVCRRHVD